MNVIDPFRMMDRQTRARGGGYVPDAVIRGSSFVI
jgi:hypothetical protein